MRPANTDPRTARTLQRTTAADAEHERTGKQEREGQRRFWETREPGIYIARTDATLVEQWTDRERGLTYGRAHGEALRDEEADRVARYVEDLDAARERAAVTQEELDNRLAEQMNSRMYVLSLVAALFLPLGFLTGLLGINVGGIPLADDPMGFVEVVIILVVLVAIQVVIFMRKKWF